MEFSENNLVKANKIVEMYPHKASAIMPLLTLIQEQNSGYLDVATIDCVADFVGVAYMAVYEVASFYSMYNLRPVGKYLIQMCHSVVCYMSGFESLYQLCKELTGTLDSQVSKDGLFSVKKVECLGACVNAYVLKINDIFIEDVTKEKLISVIESLKNNQLLEEVVKVKRSLLEQ